MVRYLPLATLSYMAENCGMVVFNVDYRLAPEAKCPENIEDFYSALKYVLANASTLGVDAGRVGIWGESGGGYLTAGLCVLLAQRDESHLVKLAVPVIPMLTDYCWTDPASMTRFAFILSSMSLFLTAISRRLAVRFRLSLT